MSSEEATTWLTDASRQVKMLSGERLELAHMPSTRVSRAGFRHEHLGDTVALRVDRSGSAVHTLRRGGALMRTEAGVTRIFNGQLVDGTGSPPTRDAIVMVDNGRITYAGPAAGAPAQAPNAQQIDANGGTIMPGLVESHFHATYFNVAHLEDLDIKYPVEIRRRCWPRSTPGWPSSAATRRRDLRGSLFNIDVWLKKAIENDLVPGPRLAASGREICGAGGLMDWNPDFRKIGMEGLILARQRRRFERAAPPSQAREGRRRMGQDLPHRRRRRTRHQRPPHAVHDVRGDARGRRDRAQPQAARSPATAGRPRASRTRCAPATTRIEHGTFIDDECSTCCSSATCRAFRRCTSSWPASNAARSSAAAAGDRRAQGDAGRRRRERPHAS